MPTINDSVQYLKGVGPAFAKKFEKLGIVTIRDLLLCYPRKYIDYTQPYTVVSAPYDMDCCVRATVLQKEPPRRITGGRVMNRVLAADDSGILSMTWFNASYAANNLVVGETYYFEGRIGGTLTRREISHPLVRTEAQVAACPFVAVYPGTDGLPAARHASCAHAALAFADELNKKSQQYQAVKDSGKLENGPLCTFVEPVAKRDGYGSTDVGDVQHIVPCVQVMTATCNLAAPGHSWQITSCAGMSIGMKGMLFGSKVMAATAMKLVEDPKLVEQAKEEFNKQMNGRTYNCPIPKEIPVPQPQNN